MIQIILPLLITHLTPLLSTQPLNTLVPTPIRRQECHIVRLPHLTIILLQEVLIVRHLILIQLQELHTVIQHQT